MPLTTPPSPSPNPPPAEASPWLAWPLHPALQAAVQALGWAQPTPVQQAALPALLQGRDAQVVAPTGSGKTAAFLLPLLQRLLADGGLAALRPRPLRLLVLAPTRELAAQTAQLAAALAPTLRCVLAVGGVSINPQMMALRGGAHLVVATPGRLLDLLDQRALRLDQVQALVLDEADRLLELGFADELGRVLAQLPARRQTVLVTATLPPVVATLAWQTLREPLKLDIVQSAGLPASVAAPALPPPEAAADDSPAAAIHQRAVLVDTPRRLSLLRHLMDIEGWERVLVFVATQYATEHLADKLQRAGLAAEALHGQLSQGRRSQVLADFIGGGLPVLVATDLAARGLDVPGLGVVVQFDLPRSPTDYTHRIGRTGRAGASGQAISFICADTPGSEAHFRLIEKRQGQRVPRETVAGFEPAAPLLLAPADPNGGVKGHRKSKKDKLREAAAVAAANAAWPKPPRR